MIRERESLFLVYPPSQAAQRDNSRAAEYSRPHSHRQAISAHTKKTINSFMIPYIAYRTPDISISSIGLENTHKSMHICAGMEDETKIKRICSVRLHVYIHTRWSIIMWHRCSKVLQTQQCSWQCGNASVFSTPPSFLFSTPAPSFTSSLLPSLPTPPVPLSWAPGIFRYWSPHYGSIQPQQTHKQISRLRRSQSPSPSLLCCAIRPQHTPVRWARGKAYCRLQPPLAPPPNPSASQPRVTAAPNTIKSHLQNAQA